MAWQQMLGKHYQSGHDYAGKISGVGQAPVSNQFTGCKAWSKFVCFQIKQRLEQERLLSAVELTS